MSWTEMLLLLMLINLLTQSQWKMMKMISMMSTLSIITYMYNNTQTLSNNTWTTFMQIWMLMGGLFLLKTMNTHDLTTMTMSSSMMMASIMLTTFKNWIMLYMTMELITMTTLLLMSFNNKNAQSKEASIKYLILSAISSTMLITGMLLATYNQNSYTMLLKTLLSSNNNLMLTMMLFKMGSAPFHIWMTDMYEGTKTKNLPIIMLMPKIAIISTMLTFEMNNNILLMCGMLSTIMGAMGAMNQKKIKRLLAYSSMNNTGIMMMGLHIYTLPSMQASIIHIMMYTMTLTIILMTLQHTYNKNNLISEMTQNDNHNSKNKIMMSMLLLSLSGLPPFPGFLSKWLMMSSTMKQQLLLTSTWMLMTNMPSTAYYFYTIIFSYFKKMKTKLNSIREKKVKYQYMMATLTYPTLSILMHPQLILMPSWTASTTMLNVPINNKNTTHSLFLNIYKSKKN